MACLVFFVSFSFPISASTLNTFSEEKNPWKLALDRPLRQLSNVTEAKLSTSRNITESISTLNRISRDHCLASLKSQCEASYCPRSVKSCTLMVISGYWVSPDIDDGWGFVDAFVNRVI